MMAKKKRLTQSLNGKVRESSPYEIFARNQVSRETRRCYAYQLKAFQQFVEEDRGLTNIDEITTADILSYKDSLEDLAPSTQKRYLATIKSFFRWVHEVEIIPTDPSAKIKLPRAVQGRAPTFITIEETRDLLDTVNIEDRYARRDLAMLWCFAHGLRLAEVAALNIGDVVPDVGNNLAQIKVQGKGSKARTVPIGENAYKAIAEYIQQRGDGNADAPLFACTYAGMVERRISRRGIQERFRVLCERAGLPENKRHPHVMRHGFATRMLFQSNTPGGIYTVSRLLGHSRVSTTEMYLHCSLERLEAAMLCDPLAGAE